MRRADATARVLGLVDRLIAARLDPVGRGVSELFVVGSYARGAASPGDVDVALLHDNNDAYAARARARAGGPAPFAALLAGDQALHVLAVTRRAQLGGAHPEAVLIWRRGEPRSLAEERLAGIAIDPSATSFVDEAVRAELRPLVARFDGASIGRLARFEAAGLIRLEPAELEDAGRVPGPLAELVCTRWSDADPEQRLALDAIALLERTCGAAQKDIDVDGLRLDTHRTDQAYVVVLAVEASRAAEWLEVMIDRFGARMVVLCGEPVDASRPLPVLLVERVGDAVPGRHWAALVDGA